MKTNNSFNHPYLAALKERFIIFDGAMGTNLESQNLTTRHFGGEKFNGCNDHLNLSFPEAVNKVHTAFLEAGVDVIETNTFRSNRFTLCEFDLADKVNEINYAGAQIARQCIDAFSSDGRKRFVAGSMGPTGKIISIQTGENNPAEFDDLKQAFFEQALALIKGGVDLLLLETQQDILEVKAAIQGIHQAIEESQSNIPIQVHVTVDVNGRTLTGTDISAVAAILSDIGIDILGVNCSTGPSQMQLALEILSRESYLPISCMPNAGMPENKDGKAVYRLLPEEFSEIMASLALKFGLAVLGGCCGTTPEHLGLLVKKLVNQKKPVNHVFQIPRLSSAFHPLNMRQVPAPLIIGERLNTQGSHVFKKAVLSGNFDQALKIARDQMENGAHALDICTALTETPGEIESLQKVVCLISSNIDAPLVIDSTDPEAMRAALKAAPGRCLLNSINLEAGEEKARRVLDLAKNYNCALIALTIDEQGMASSANKKLEIARRIHSIAVNEFGLKSHDLVFDPLTFTLASGLPETVDASVETLQAIQLIKDSLPGTLTCLGISNISYGLKSEARSILNSVFLYHAVQYGLDMVIINPSQIRPYPEISAQERWLAENLIFNRGDDPLEKFIRHFEETQPGKRRPKENEMQMLALDQRIYHRILYREKAGLENDLDEYIHRNDDYHENALSLLDAILLPAMKEIGDQFGQGELILPFVLQSAEIMRAATEHLEKYLDSGQAPSKGKIVLATVFGDVHDIGKNLVKTILSNNGFDVIDMGKQVPADVIVSEALATNACAIGLSALLVSTSQQMGIVVDKLRELGSKIPVLVGGAAINESFAKAISLNKEGHPYEGGVFYCRDAFEALKILNGTGSSNTRNLSAGESSPMTDSDRLTSLKHSLEIKENVEIPDPPFWGYKLIKEIPLDQLMNLININALFRISWGAKNAQGDKWEKLSGQFTEMLEEMQKSLLVKSWLKVSALYGYWPCNSTADEVVIYDIEKPGTEKLLSLNFPRQSGEVQRCLADYFRPMEDGQIDVAAFQIVTLGQDSADHVHKLQEEEGITAAFYSHGLAVQLTEAAARYTHSLIQQELGLTDRRSKRYSWGFPALPDLSQHELLFKLLPAERELGIRMTSAYQFIPEYTTAAMIIHHPDAEYFRMD